MEKDDESLFQIWNSDQKPEKQTSTNTFTQYLYNFKEVQFIGQIALGSKKKIFKVIFDSGSSALWVTTPKDMFAKGKLHYSCDKKESTTCKKGNFAKKFIGYGSGKIYGNIVTEDIWIPNIVTKRTKISDEGLRQIKGEYLSNKANTWGHIKDQDIILVHDSPGMSKVKADGVLGVGPSDKADIKSIFTNLKKQGVIEKEIFSIYLSTDEKKKPSELEIGGYDKVLVEKTGNEIVWAPILGKEKWKIALDDVLIDDKSIYAKRSVLSEALTMLKQIFVFPDFSNINNKVALIDSGSSWIIITLSDGEKYLEACKKRGVDCKLDGGMIFCIKDSNWIDKLPKIEFVIKGKKYPIKNDL